MQWAYLGSDNCRGSNFYLSNALLPPVELLFKQTVPYLSPSRAGQHIGQCVSSSHLCPPLRRLFKHI